VREGNQGLEAGKRAALIQRRNPTWEDLAEEMFPKEKKKD
jgi:hypothetical protein